jgi:peptidyl-prolyl cis-trans isomerase C
MTLPPAASRLALALFLSFAAGISAAEAESKTLATVDGQAITEQDVDDAMGDIGANLPEKSDMAARRKYVLDYLVDLKLVARKAYADKLDADPEFARKLAYYRDKIAMETMLGKVAKDADTDTAEHAAYDEAA